MVSINKSQPEPACLAVERNKISGDYKCDNVLDVIKNDFKNKCYICEDKEPTCINVEHFIPHRGNRDIKFDWNNLFWSCSHCNNTKLDNYIDILNCTIESDDVEKKLRYILKPFPFEEVSIESIVDDRKVELTKELLLAVYNGSTVLKKIESANLRNKILIEICDFQKYLVEYFADTNTEDDKEYFLIRIRAHLNKGSNFTAFKRWIIRDNARLMEEFGQFLE